MKYLCFLCFLFSFAASAERFADRYYVTNVLVNNFGEKSKTIVLDNIFKNPELFGGSCDYYEQVRVGPNDYANPPERNCFGGKQEFALPLSVPYSKSRSSLMIKVCNELISCQDCISFFLEKIKYNDSKSKVDSVLSAFFWNDQMVQKLKPEFEKIYDRYWFPSKKQRMLIMNACIDHRWQII